MFLAEGQPAAGRATCSPLLSSRLQTSSCAAENRAVYKSVPRRRPAFVQAGCQTFAYQKPVGARPCSALPQRPRRGGLEPPVGGQQLPKGVLGRYTGTTFRRAAKARLPELGFGCPRMTKLRASSKRSFGRVSRA